MKKTKRPGRPVEIDEAVRVDIYVPLSLKRKVRKKAADEGRRFSAVARDAMEKGMK